MFDAGTVIYFAAIVHIIICRWGRAAICRVEISSLYQATEN